MIWHGSTRQDLLHDAMSSSLSNIHIHRKESDGEALKQASSHPDNVVPVILDVTKHDQIDEARGLIEEELSKRGGLPFTGLINNAGVAGYSEPIEFIDLNVIKWVHEVNFYGAIAVTKAFLPLLRKSQGRIINISR